MVSAFSVPKSKREYKYNNVPGPGQYNPETSPKVVKQSDPKYRQIISLIQFWQINKKVNPNMIPGPGSYEVKQSIIVNKNPSYTMLGKKQLNQSRLDIGPGQYQPMFTAAKQKSPAYSMKGRSYSTLQHKPGPGQYQPKIELFKKGGNAFGKDSRIRQYQTKVPGPGSYDYETAVFKYGSKNQPSYGFGSKLQSKNHSFAPGPGQYEPKKQIYSRIGGIISRDMHSSMILSKTPGPGSYDEDSYSKIKSKDPQWSMSKSSRDYIDQKNPLGPGQYETDKTYKSIINSTPGYNFGSEKRISDYKNNVPGPGSYQQNLLKSRMSIKIGEKTKQLSNSYVPGPGEYQSVKYDKDAWLKGQGRYSIGKSSRDELLKSQVPGPGSYDKKILDGKGKITFGKDSRIKNLSNNIPGPGAYTLKPTFADVPKYLLPDKN